MQKPLTTPSKQYQFSFGQASGAFFAYWCSCLQAAAGAAALAATGATPTGQHVCTPLPQAPHSTHTAAPTRRPSYWRVPRVTMPTSCSYLNCCRGFLTQ